MQMTMGVIIALKKILRGRDFGVRRVQEKLRFNLKMGENGELGHFMADGGDERGNEGEGECILKVVKGFGFGKCGQHMVLLVL
ncbi:hypothetical protein KY289_020490 [Solanum tuberosum]|nr:hypothetical protein KY289_020490 [Solanum tuberosum]